MDLREKMTRSKRHPWELSRARCVLNIIKQYHLSAAADIGAGDRFFTRQLASVIPGAVYAVDTGYAEKAAPVDGIHCLNDIAGLPELTGGGVILMDVLEHIKNDAVFLQSILEKIPQGGLIFITVPAFQFLFSAHDEFLKHYRRYRRKTLLALLNDQGLYIHQCHYFYTSLFWARAAGLLLKKKNLSGIGTWRFAEKNIITRLVCALLNFDFYLCAFLARFRVYPPGLSLLAICRKQANKR
jgi:hypothetical protein